MGECNWHGEGDFSEEVSEDVAPKPGNEMSDGTILAGISPDTHKPMYATPSDAPLTHTFNEAQD